MTDRSHYIVIFVISLVCVSSSRGTENGTDRYMNFPRSLEEGSLHYAVGVSWTLLARAIVEEEIRQIPMVNAAIRYELPLHFSLSAQLSTVYITSVLTAGTAWSYSMDNVSFALSNEFSYWFGVADMSGFDTKAMGLLTRPAFSIGVDIDSYQITAKTEMMTILTQHTYFGSASVAKVKPEIAGIATTLYLEQDLWKSTVVSFALRANYARPNYQVWLAFSVQDRWLFFPELQVSYIF